MAAESDLAHVRRRFAVTAEAVDRGDEDVRAGLRRLGAYGLLAARGDRGARIAGAARLIRTLASVSLADAFAVWSQTMVLDYLTTWPDEHSTAHAAVVEGLTGGTVCGATALAPAIADVAGGRPVPIQATRRERGWTLTGPVPWASNLFPGAVVVVPARTSGDGRVVVPVRLDARGVVVTPSEPLLALDATGTGSIALEDVPVRDADVLSTDLGRFLGVCRPTMVVTQACLALGLADGALEATAASLGGPTLALKDELDDVIGRRDEVAGTLERILGDLGSAGPAAGARLRLAALDVAARAVELEGIAHGGSGFRMATGTARRRREAAFLPIQAPAVLQLRAAARAG